MNQSPQLAKWKRKLRFYFVLSSISAALLFVWSVWPDFGNQIHVNGEDIPKSDPRYAIEVRQMRLLVFYGGLGSTIMALLCHRIFPRVVEWIYDV